MFSIDEAIPVFLGNRRKMAFISGDQSWEQRSNFDGNRRTKEKTYVYGNRELKKTIF